ncbi:Fic family protein [Eggerthella sinensis]|uniref:Cell filamentation protein Fic n=1 Tax=Eggerthella sinensis TaxID=242230 RepID=A0A3N0J122_9ACTN|nr:Fic family protein [Eggerthella sinensis]RDB68785.1 cell filamentation protein Fic [Eggerthella sinensis]RNM42939.1 cell filamentation protein Fic [Eggerthella sinensis]
MEISNRSGRYVMQPSGYRAFVPNPLPPEPPLVFSSELMSLLSEADRKLGRLDGVTQVLPNPDLFVSMYVKKEALLSSQIEGTQASLQDVLAIEESRLNDDTLEVANYIEAMNFGLDRLREFPLSLRLLREIHARLLATGRGSERTPGEFRHSQNWIGAQGCTLNEAAYVPPAVEDMHQALGDLESFFYSHTDLPTLVKIGLIHAQFETIHPFLDGNGRMGRLLIAFWLCNEGVLSKPVLYLSYFFKRNRQEYYDRLMDVRRKGAWEEWLAFFLRGIAQTSEEGVASAKKIIALQNDGIRRINEARLSANHAALLDRLFESPSITKQKAARVLAVSEPTAKSVIDNLCALGILKDATPRSQRNKRFVFQPYLDILEPGTDPL